jgi:hypothetical protein
MMEVREMPSSVNHALDSKVVVNISLSLLRNHETINMKTRQDDIVDVEFIIKGIFNRDISHLLTLN